MALCSHLGLGVSFYKLKVLENPSAVVCHVVQEHDYTWAHRNWHRLWINKQVADQGMCQPLGMDHIANVLNQDPCDVLNLKMVKMDFHKDYTCILSFCVLLIKLMYHKICNWYFLNLFNGPIWLTPSYLDLIYGNIASKTPLWPIPVFLPS